jgi:glutamate formiminotransferase
MIMILQKSCTSSLVACNIYITAAATASSTLPSLLARAQDHCRQLRLQNCTQKQQEEEQIDSSSNNNKRSVAAAIVHAYADIPYDRSSFHLAGQSDCVAEVAIGLIQNALNEIEVPSNHLSSNKNGADANDATKLTTGDKPKETRHPYVGLVDHVSVMPIACKEEDSTTTNSNAAMNAANAARKIGSAISDKNSINMHYYGLACPNQTSLATVRRRKTSFFNSGGALDSSGCNEVDSSNNNNDIPKQQSQKCHYEKGECTIGTPPQFVENYNIRLTRNVDFNTAKTLTQALRGRNISTKGMGVPGVEALTLPYHRDASLGGDVFEVACNLTEPKDGSVEKIEEQLEKWIAEQQQHHQLLSNLGEVNSKRNRDFYIEKAYRVGTTEEQCINILNDEEDNRWIKHDIQVLTRFKEYLMA